MITRVTYDFEGETLKPSGEQPWIASAEPWKSPLGEFSQDQPFRKGGVDIFVHAEACAPRGIPATEVKLEVTIGALRAEAVAIGRRVWQRGRGRALVPSTPEPFVTMPIGLDRAFGGKAELDGLDTSYPLNPDGIGFYANEQAAENQPLPCIEHPNRRISNWNDAPLPVGFGLCQFPHPLRSQDAFTVNATPPDKENPIDIVNYNPQITFSPRMFNRAFPGLILETAVPGDRVTASGFSPDGPISFILPPIPVMVRVTLGSKTVERIPYIEDIGIDVPNRRVFLGYRYPFRYKFVPYEQRLCSLYVAGESHHA